jgi:hypothetical protein
MTGWDNFYVIMGSSAGGLTGLTFVVIALAADMPRVNIAGLRAFVTPTVVHFGTVLALAAFLNVPRQSMMSLSAGFGAAGLAGLAYAGIIVKSMRGFSNEYRPVCEDWLWHVLWPVLVYGALFVMAFLIWHHPQQSLYGVAACSMLLLFIGIHNAWDVAVSISLGRKEPDSR